MAKPNYQYEKRQRDLAKKKKKEDKKQRKLDGAQTKDESAPPSESGEAGETE